MSLRALLGDEGVGQAVPKLVSNEMGLIKKSRNLEGRKTFPCFDKPSLADPTLQMAKTKASVFCN